MTDAPYDYWNPEEEDTAAPVTDAYDDYWKPDEKEPDRLVTDRYDVYWKPEETDTYAPVTDNYDSWKEAETTPPAPEVDGKAGTDDSEYWDAKCMCHSSYNENLVLMNHVVKLLRFVGP